MKPSLINPADHPLSADWQAQGIIGSGPIRRALVVNEAAVGAELSRRLAESRAGKSEQRKDAA